MQRAAKQAGATTIALVNDADSPAAHDADALLPLHAGEERSVAATKSMIASLVAGLSLVARWSEDVGLVAALDRLPAILDASLAAPPEEAVDTAGEGRLPLYDRPRRDLRRRRRGGAEIQGDLGHPRRGVLVGRGAARTGRRHRPGLSQYSASRRPTSRATGFFETVERLASFGAAPLIVDVAPHPRWPTLVAPDGGHPLMTPIAALHAFYRLAEAVARRRGRDPDQPPHLMKVTRTV